MSTHSQKSRVRRTGAERRAQILEAARVEFARAGLHGTSVEAIAARAGISQAYVFRFFRTKLELFLPAIDLGFDRVQEAFAAAAEGLPREERLAAMGRRYRELLADRDALMGQMQAYAACGDPLVQEHVRRRFGDLARFVVDATGADDDTLQAFFARGMLLNVAAALGLGDGLARESWVPRCFGIGPGQPEGGAAA